MRALIEESHRAGLAEAANKAKTEFLANMSHELRTPLHSILSFADFGITKVESAQPQKLQHYFSKIKNSGSNLLSLLNNLLDLAKLESGRDKITFEPANLSELITTVIEEFYAQIKQRNITIQLDDSDFNGQVAVDIEKFKQVIRNLVSNAVKFSPDGGVITIELSGADEKTVVSVRDRGPGVPQNELEAVFDRFVQSSKTKTGAGGTGLGLAICRSIIESHHGRIWAENGEDGGAVFLFEIPTTQPQRDESPTDKAQTKAVPAGAGKEQ